MNKDPEITTFRFMDKLGHLHSVEAKTIEQAIQEVNERPAVAQLGDWLTEDDVIATFH